MSTSTNIYPPSPVSCHFRNSFSPYSFLFILIESSILLYKRNDCKRSLRLSLDPNLLRHCRLLHSLRNWYKTLFFSRFLLGANDVANAFATSVGGGALKLVNALVIAGICEFLGAFLMGSHVTETIQKEITDINYFADSPEVLMYGMFCVLLCVGIWLILATNFGLPVSTTHSCIGGIIGMAVTAKGFGAVHWSKIIEVVASWLISPVLSGCVSSLIFYIVRKYILRTTNSLQRGLSFYPIIAGFTVFVVCFFIFFKGSPQLHLDELPVWLVFVICISVAVIVGLALQFWFVPILKKRIEAKRQEDTLNQQNKTKTIEIELGEVTVHTAPEKTIEVSAEGAESEGKEVAVEINKEDASAEAKKEEAVEANKEKAKGLLAHQNIHAQLEDEQSTVYKIHQHAENFDPYTESIFGYLQIITAIMNSFAHGANDVANAIGPFASVITIYQTGSIEGDAEVPLWILVIGGLGIVTGLACLGYKVMAAIGVNIIKVTPSRGFSIDVGGAFTVVFGSRLGLPLSTTHCIVGSTIGVGLVEGAKSVNWSLVISVFTGWIMTLVVCALSTAAIFAFGIYAPTVIPPVQPVNGTAFF